MQVGITMYVKGNVETMADLIAVYQILEVAVKAIEEKNLIVTQNMGQMSYEKPQYPEEAKETDGYK